MMLFFPLFILFLVCVFFLYKSLLKTPNPPLKHFAVRVEDISFDTEIAADMVSRSRGLSFRKDLAENAGMLFIFNKANRYGFWMKDMNFPIDIIWIKNYAIVGFSENAQPEPQKTLLQLQQYYPPEPADRVLEVPAGTVQKYQFKVGDKINYELQ